MALPVFESVGTFGASLGNVTPDMPASVAVGDLLLLLVESANEAITAPSGWTEVTNSPQSTGTPAAAGGVRLGVFWRIATGSDAVTVTDTGDHTVAVVARFTGAHGTTPIHVTAGDVLAIAGTTVICPSVTTSIADCLIVNAVGTDRDINSTTYFSAWTNALLSDVTERQDQTSSLGAGGGLGASTGGLATAGVAGATTVTQATSVTAAMITLAIAPVAAGAARQQTLTLLGLGA